MKKRWVLIVLSAVLFCIGLPSSSPAQKQSRPAATVHRSRLSELTSIDQLKEAFRGDEHKIRLVALLSPT